MGTAGDIKTRLAISFLEGVAQQLIERSVAPTTARSYRSAQKFYLDFCGRLALQPIPSTEHTMILYVAELSQRLCYSTIQSYLSAVRHLHLTTGHKDPLKDTVQLELVLKGVKRWRPRSERHRLPITPYILNTMLTVLLQNPQEYNNIMLWAACCLGFFAFLRSGEFTAPASTFDPTWHLSPQDILVDIHATPSMLEIKIKGSKTDQTRRGVSLFVGRTHNCLCPVTAILAYLAVRGTSPGPLFLLKDGTTLTRQKLVKMVQSTLQLAGIDPSGYSGHSFRIGAATTAAAKGIDADTIRTLGRWSSDTYQRYIQIPRQELAIISQQIAKPC